MHEEPGSTKLVAIGASAGGLAALTVVLSALPRDLPAAVLIVQHLDPRYPSHMAEILGRRCDLPCVEAQDGQEITNQMVYIAPPDRHMLVEEGHIRLTRTNLVHFVRPSVDLLFESVVAAYGESAIAVILTGSGTDGALGIRAIKEKGGISIVQDPITADTRGMPVAAIAMAQVDHILPLNDIGATIVDAVYGRLQSG